MKPALTDLSEQVWLRTLPALRQRRATRVAIKAGAGVATLLLAIFALALSSADQPAEYSWITRPASSDSGPAKSSTLAVLVVDQSGVRFQELAPEQLAGEEFDLRLTLEPVITGPGLGIY